MTQNMSYFFVYSKRQFAFQVISYILALGYYGTEHAAKCTLLIQWSLFIIWAYAILFMTSDLYEVEVSVRQEIEAANKDDLSIIWKKPLLA